MSGQGGDEAFSKYDFVTRWFLRNRGAIAVVSVLNFLLLVASIAYFGGDGLLCGFQRGGRYFVENHGVVTEISRFGYHFTAAHLVVSVAIHLGVMVLGAAALDAEPDKADAGPDNPARSKRTRP